MSNTPKAQPPDESSLRAAIGALDDDDILALCYGFATLHERLRLYLDVLRKRGGSRAQFAACLICFDLARQGDPACQQEFLMLTDTMRSLAANKDLVRSLLGSSDYLNFVWDLCQAALADMDNLATQPAGPKAGAPIAQLALLTETDFADLPLSIDERTLWRRFDDAVEVFLGGVVGVPVYDQNAGFRMHHKRDAERMETFLNHLDSLRAIIPPARGFRALTLLFYGANMRTRTLFGSQNARKQQLLRDGVEEFMQSGPEVWSIVGVMGAMHAGDDAWGKISGILLDYTYHVATHGRAVEFDPAAASASRPR